MLRALEVERADVVGYSQGGGVAIQLAVRHGTLVNKLVSMSATFRRDGWYPVVGESIGRLGAGAFAGTAVEKMFLEHTPDTVKFEAYIAKMKELNVNDQHISEEQMRSIPAKTMVIVGDADGVTLEHAVEMFRLRGGGDEQAAATGVLQDVPAARLLVLPAMSHIGIAAACELVTPLVSAFLDDIPPVTPELF